MPPITINSFFDAWKPLLEDVDKSYKGEKDKTHAPTDYYTSLIDNSFEFVYDEKYGICLDQKLTGATKEELDARKAAGKVAKEKLIEALKGSFPKDLCDLGTGKGKIIDVTSDTPLTMRDVRQVVDTLSMAKNVKEALSRQPGKISLASEVKRKLAELAWPKQMEKTDTLSKDMVDGCIELAEQCDKAYKKLKEMKGGKLAAQLCEGKGRAFDAYEAYADALAALTDGLSWLDEKLTKSRESDTRLLSGLIDDVALTAGALHRASALLVEAHVRGYKDFKKLTLDAFLAGPSVTKNVQGAKSATQIALGLGALLTAVAEVDNGLVEGDQVDGLLEEIRTAKEELSNVETDGSVNTYALKQFIWQLTEAEKRLAELSKAIGGASNDIKDDADGSGTVVQTLKNAETVRQVMNDEQNVGFLVQMLKAGATDGMINPLFAADNRTEDLKKVEERDNATIYRGTWKDPKTGQEVTAYAKRLTDPSMLTTQTVLNGASADAEKMAIRRAKYQAATAKAAGLLGMGRACVQTGVTMIEDDLYLVSEEADGVSGGGFAFLDKTEKSSFSCGLKVDGKPFMDKLNKNQQEAFIGQLLVQANRLEWLDAFTGEQDRHLDNMKLDVDIPLEKNGQSDITVTIRGFDNVECFGKYRSNPQAFVINKNDKFVLNRIAENVPGLEEDLKKAIRETPTNYVTISLADWGSHNVGRFCRAFGINNMVEPAFVTSEVYREVMRSGKWNDLEKELAPLLTPDEIKMAKSRFAWMKEHMRTLQKAGLVFDESALKKDPAIMKKAIAAINSKIPKDSDPGAQEGGPNGRQVRTSYASLLMWQNGGLNPFEGGGQNDADMKVKETNGSESDSDEGDEG